MKYSIKPKVLGERRGRHEKFEDMYMCDAMYCFSKLQ